MQFSAIILAMGQGSILAAGVLLAVYGAGMVVPLVIIAAAGEKLGARGQRLLRGRTTTVLGREFHTTSLITGLLIIGVGLLFWFTNGLASMPPLVPAEVRAWAQVQGAALSGPLFDIIGIALLASIAIVAWALARRRAA